MDLQSLGCMDCDLRHIYVINPEPTGDDLLDPILQALAMDPVQATRAILDEFHFLSEEGEAIRDRALQRLVDRGILQTQERKVLWIFGARHYLVQNDQALRASKLRILNSVLGNDIPDPRDIALISLLQACGLFRAMLKVLEYRKAEKRIAQVARMDILGRFAAEAVAEVEASMAMASGLR